MWTVKFRPKKIEAKAAALSEGAQVNLASLIEDLKKSGPAQASWPHYGQLKGQKGQKKTEKRYHCHLLSGRPTIVACWRAFSSTLTAEIYYVGTHENAPY